MRNNNIRQLSTPDQFKERQKYNRVLQEIDPGAVDRKSTQKDIKPSNIYTESSETIIDESQLDSSPNKTEEFKNSILEVSPNSLMFQADQIHFLSKSMV